MSGPTPPFPNRWTHYPVEIPGVSAARSEARRRVFPCLPPPRTHARRPLMPDAVYPGVANATDAIEIMSLSYIFPVRYDAPDRTPGLTLSRTDPTRPLHSLARSRTRISL